MVLKYIEGGSGAGIFLAEFGEGVTVLEPHHSYAYSDAPPTLFRLSDSTGQVIFESVNPPIYSSLSFKDAFLLDDSMNVMRPAIYVWIGKGSSLNEHRLAVQYAQTYIYNKRSGAGHGGERHDVQVAISLVKMNEGDETNEFSQLVHK